MHKKNIGQIIGGAGGLLVVLAILVLLNMLVHNLRIRADLTEDNLYTLSDGTRSLLDGLQRPVTLKFYFSRSNENIPMPLKQYGERIRDLLQEYRANSGGRVILEVYDPKPDSDEEEWAQRYGLVGQGLGFGGGGSFYAGLVAVAGRDEAAIPFLSPGLEPQLEYMITRLIYQVTQQEKPVVGVMSALPVMGFQPPMMPGMPQQQPPRPAWMFVQELERQYEVEDVPLMTESIPEHINTLLVIHPKDIQPATLFALDQFILRGGRLVVFVDPQCTAEAETTPQQNPYGFLMAASDINRLSSHWGITMQSGNVIADNALASRVGMGGGGAELMPTWLSLRPEHINRDEIVTSSLEFIMMPFAGGFTGNPVEGLQIDRLFTTSPQAAYVNSFQASSSGAEKMKEAKSAGQVTLGLRLRGTFKTAFPDGPPNAPTPGEDEEETPDAYLKEGEGIVVMVSDADMLYDRFCVRTFNFLGQTVMEPLNDNLNFAINLVEEMTGTEALIGLRSRGTYDRPFHKVIELEEKAQARWQNEELKLLAQLEETQNRISELQEAKAEDQAFILSPEQKEEIEKFREKRFETQQALKDVRKKLRRDIERLGLTVKVINIAAVPALVALFGLAYGWRRRKREKI